MPDAQLNGKPRSYYENARPELVALLPDRLGRLPDVGCGAGGVGRSLRARADVLVGIEPNASAAAEAEEIYDTVIVGTVEGSLPSLDGPFDTVLCYDVLEHLVDPETVLAELRQRAAPGALLHVSVPNARQWTLLRDLIVRGTFGYTDVGHRDRTHLRWLTKRDLVEMVEEAGWHVECVTHAPSSAAGRLFERLTRGRSAEFLVYQWSALARAS